MLGKVKCLKTSYVYLNRINGYFPEKFRKFSGQLLFRRSLMSSSFRYSTGSLFGLWKSDDLSSYMQLNYEIKHGMTKLKSADLVKSIKICLDQS